MEKPSLFLLPKQNNILLHISCVSNGPLTSIQKVFNSICLKNGYTNVLSFSLMIINLVEILPYLTEHFLHSTMNVIISSTRSLNV